MICIYIYIIDYNGIYIYIYIMTQDTYTVPRPCMRPFEKKKHDTNMAKIPILFVLGVGSRCIHKVCAYILVMSM